MATPRRTATPRSRRRVAAYAFAAMVVTAGLLAGAATGTFSGLARSALYGAGIYRDGGTSTVPPGFFDTPAASSRETPRGPEDPVLEPLPKARNPRGSVLVDRVSALSTDGIGTPGFAVGDPVSGTMIGSSRGSAAMIPASAMKLLTGLAVLDAYGPEHRFTTTVVSSTSGSLVLVGRGDPYLAKQRRAGAYPARASLDDLADQVAKSMKAGGASATPITLDWDATLFTGPAWNPTWPGTYSDQATPTSALWVDEGRKAGAPGPREADPARAAATAFTVALSKRGLKVSLGEPAKAPAGAAVLATAQSMPLSQIVEEVLLHSDNDGAEVLFRQVALADRRAGSVAEARTAVQRRLDALGAWSDNAVVHDGSGLSRADRVTPATFLRVLELALSTKHPEFRSLITGLPVAGTDGSLRYRFFADGTAVGRGDVHAKTGTLTGVHALAGYATTADGAVVAFAFVVNDATNDYNARTWLDRAASVVAACGC